MRKVFYILTLLCLCVLCAHAQTIVLRTGTRVKGEIVFQNEDVVILRDASGARFQYPRTDVEAILSDDEDNDAAPVDENAEESKITTPKKASILLEAAGGAAVNPNQAVGGGFSVDLLVGSHHIKNKHLFIGGGLGYHGLFIGAEKYNFLPIQVALRMPFTETKHAPVFGASVGYGIALSKTCVGGLYAGVDLGYRCQINPKTAVSIVAFTQFQQAQIPVTETIGSESFTHMSGRNLVMPGVKLALYF